MLQVELETVNSKLGIYGGFVYREHLPVEIRGLFSGDFVEVEGDFRMLVEDGHTSVVLEGCPLLYQGNNPLQLHLKLDEFNALVLEDDILDRVGRTIP